MSLKKSRKKKRKKAWKRVHSIQIFLKIHHTHFLSSKNSCCKSLVNSKLPKLFNYQTLGLLLWKESEQQMKRKAQSWKHDKLIKEP